MGTPSSTQNVDARETASGTVFSEAATLNTLVIGYGNPLRGDDGFGWRVAERLLETKHERLEVIVCHQLTPELAEPLSRADRAVFVDASLSVPLGQLEVRELEVRALNPTMAHHLEPTQLLALARRLYGRAAHATMISIGVSSLEYTQHLSIEVQAAIPRAVKAIVEVQQGAQNRAPSTG